MRPRVNRLNAVVSATLLALLGVTAAGQGGKTAKDGVYSEEQAKRGEATYQDKCASCHADDLSGGGMAPALAKQDFLGSWSDQKLDALASRIKDTMPADKPGTLSPDGVADVMAFILKSNGFAAGQQPLSTDLPALQAITIAKP